MPKREADHSATSTAGIKKGCLITGTTLLLRIQVFWDVTMRRFVSSTNETSGTTHQMTQRNTPEWTPYYTAMKIHLETFLFSIYNPQMHNIFNTCFLKHYYLFRCLNASSSSGSSYYAKDSKACNYGIIRTPCWWWWCIKASKHVVVF